MSATLPTNFNPNHAPTAAELGQILSAITRITNIAILRTASVSYTGFTTASYTDIGGMSMSYTKNGSAVGSDLLVIMGVGWRASVAPTAADFGVNINAADTDVIHYEITNSANAHFSNFGFNKITGVPAGTYTVKGRMRRTGGTGGMAADGQDIHFLLVAELPK